ncbi:hypothetical protein [Saccharothrix sp. ST-888]|uniref:hypothetical protein n=1 Tax=Saccharothrix sp. ST-888 TaxID=1427391 RepID=UPI0005EC3BB9|nr:hypothetical protein [Saccharothrix sp. ST-888]KJK55092.1 hypothetical protein UK12_30820 [Saccharothrix sp. ST-888]
MAERKLELQSEARRAVLNIDRTERPRLVLLAISGPSQYLIGAMGLLGMLLAKSYFLTVTDRSVYIHRGPRTNAHPRELVHVVPLKEADELVSRVKHGRSWNALFLRIPGKAKPVRLNVSFHSRPELDSFLTKLPKAPERP